MTQDMAFECLLFSTDRSLLGALAPLLQDFSITTKVCADASRVGASLDRGSTDLVVLDLDAVDSVTAIRQVRESQVRQKPTVIAVSAFDREVPGAHVLLRKPITHDSGIESVKTAYSRMLRDFRKHTRFALLNPTLATDGKGREIHVTVTNIGEGGVGLLSRQRLVVGSMLDFQTTLPGLENHIQIRTRILWTRDYGAAGGEFVEVPAFDLQLLHAWLESRYRIKKPLISLED